MKRTRVSCQIFSSKCKLEGKQYTGKKKCQQKWENETNRKSTHWNWRKRRLYKEDLHQAPCDSSLQILTSQNWTRTNQKRGISPQKRTTSPTSSPQTREMAATETIWSWSVFFMWCFSNQIVVERIKTLRHCGMCAMPNSMPSKPPLRPKSSSELKDLLMKLGDEYESKKKCKKRGDQSQVLKSITSNWITLRKQTFALEELKLGTIQYHHVRSILEDKIVRQRGSCWYWAISW